MQILGLLLTNATKTASSRLEKFLHLRVKEIYLCEQVRVNSIFLVQWFQSGAFGGPIQDLRVVVAGFLQIRTPGGLASIENLLAVEFAR